MCGIFGISWKRKCKVPASQRQLLATCLAVSNSFRGSDSWGVYFSNGHEGKVEKGKGDICQVPTAHLGMIPLVMGHTRFATVGDKTKENAHPFEVKNIILAHNGAVYNHADLNKQFDRKCQVDSEHLAHTLADSCSWKDVQGYGAMEWNEGDPKSLFLCKLSYSGDLSIRSIKVLGEQVGIAWSSSTIHLEDALKAARLDSNRFEEPTTGEVYEVTNGGLFVTHRPKIELGSTFRQRGSTTASSGSEEGWAGYCGGAGRDHSVSRFREKKRDPTIVSGFRQGGHWDNALHRWVYDDAERPSDSSSTAGGSKEETAPGTDRTPAGTDAAASGPKEGPSEPVVTRVGPGAIVIHRHQPPSDTHRFLGLNQLDDGTWVNGRGETVLVDPEDMEEEEVHRWIEGYRRGSASNTNGSTGE